MSTVVNGSSVVALVAVIDDIQICKKKKKENLSHILLFSDLSRQEKKRKL
jgi:hypothetical protein